MVLNWKISTASLFFRILSVPTSSITEERCLLLLMLDWRCRWFTLFIYFYIYENDTLSYLLKCFLLCSTWLHFLLQRSRLTALFLFPWLLFGFLNFKIFGSMRRNIIFLNWKFFPQYSSIELEKHRQKVFMRSKQLFPALDSLQDLYLHTTIQILTD